MPTYSQAVGNAEVTPQGLGAATPTFRTVKEIVLTPTDYRDLDMEAI